MIINDPNISVVYFRYLLIRATNFVDCVIKPPIMRNGMPNPNEYARRRLNATLGVVAASVSIVPKIGPTHGVHPPAKARPKINDNGKLTLELLGKIFFSKFSFLILVLSNMYKPNPIIIIPPIWVKFETISIAEEVKIEFIVTPNIEKTIENPKTKNTVFNMTLDLLIKTFDWSSDLDKLEIVVPEIYAKNAGTIGRIHGAKNDPKPAIIATKIVTSFITIFHFWINNLV